MQGEAIDFIQQQQQALRSKAGMMGGQGKRRADSSLAAIAASANAEVCTPHRTFWALLRLHLYFQVDLMKSVGSTSKLLAPRPLG